MLGPPRFTTPVCFPSPEQHRSYMPLCAQPAGNWGVRYNKKGDWGVPGSGLWFINPHSFKFRTNGVGLWCALWGVILKHRTIQIHQSPVFCKRWRIDDAVAQSSRGTRENKSSEAKSSKSGGHGEKTAKFIFSGLHFHATSWAAVSFVQEAISYMLLSFWPVRQMKKRFRYKVLKSLVLLEAY